ncbi:MAG: DUF1588 domain-containing protein [Proteobacteria bacterium]|nr:MAG: DUF1588 domain-containing protein [Pseudomonadota bacterium]
MKCSLFWTLLILSLSCSGPVPRPKFDQSKNSATPAIGDKKSNDDANSNAPVKDDPGRTCAPLDNACFALKFSENDKCAMQFSPEQDGIRLLTNDEIKNSLTQIFGMDFSNQLKQLPRRNQGTKFDNALQKSAVSQNLVDNWLDISTYVASSFLSNPSALAKYITCTEVTRNCSDQIVSKLGSALWRSNATAEDLETYFRMFSENKDFKETLLRTVSVILMDPRFLYKLDTQPNQNQISAFELASRISYFLLRSTPDKILLSKAADGSLLLPEVRKSEVARLLALPEAERAFRDFMTEWLMLTNIDNLQISGEMIDPSGKRKDVLDKLSKTIFASQKDVRSAFGKEDETIFTMPGLLGSLSASAITSPVKRGIYFSSRILCRQVPPPPGNAGAFKAETLKADATPRERLKVHEDNASCAVCHSTVDPIGLGLETYDALGRTRTEYTDSKKLIETEGKMRLDGKDIAFSDANQLLKAVGNSEDLPACLTVTLFEYALGSAPQNVNSCELSSIQRKFSAHGYQWKSLVEAIIESPSFSRKAEQ